MLQTVAIPCEIPKRVTNTAYPCVYIISATAALEAKANWRETGWAYGDATVDHADWREILRREQLRHGDPLDSHKSYSVCATTATGEGGVTGCIQLTYDGAIRVSG